MSLMSIQPLYYLLSGPQHIYGLTFGSYDLTAMLFAPIFGLWTDRTRRFRAQVLLGAAVNAVGNLLYAFVFLADQWSLMLVARCGEAAGGRVLAHTHGGATLQAWPHRLLCVWRAPASRDRLPQRADSSHTSLPSRDRAIAGVGAATLGIGASYITQTTTSERRQVVLGRYRVTQNVARMAGPFVGYLFIGLPNVSRLAALLFSLLVWELWGALGLVYCAAVALQNRVAF